MTDKGDPGWMTTRQLRTRRRRLARSLPDVEGLIAGSVVEQGRRCGKEGCRCATGQAHGPYTYVVLPRSGGHTRTVYIPASAAREGRRGRISRPSISRCWPGGSWPEWPWWPRPWRCWPTWRPRRWRREVRGAEKLTSGHREG